MKRLILSILMLSSLSAYAAMQSDEYYMTIALNNAKNNIKYPFAALIVDNKSGKIMCQGLNSAYKDHNPTLHGEMVAINTCAKKYPKMDWENSTIYTTAEPCPMCQTAIIWTKMPRVVYATSIDFMNTHNWDTIKLRAEQLNSYADFYHGTVIGGVLHEKTDPLFAIPGWLQK